MSDLLCWRQHFWRTHMVDLPVIVSEGLSICPLPDTEHTTINRQCCTEARQPGREENLCAQLQIQLCWVRGRNTTPKCLCFNYQNIRNTHTCMYILQIPINMSKSSECLHRDMQIAGWVQENSWTNPNSTFWQCSCNCNIQKWLHHFITISNADSVLGVPLPNISAGSDMDGI